MEACEYEIIFESEIYLDPYYFFLIVFNPIRLPAKIKMYKVLVKEGEEIFEGIGFDREKAINNALKTLFLKKLANN
jgi:hypothetical protein